MTGLAQVAPPRASASASSQVNEKGLHKLLPLTPPPPWAHKNSQARPRDSTTDTGPTRRSGAMHRHLCSLPSSAEARARAGRRRLEHRRCVLVALGEPACVRCQGDV